MIDGLGEIPADHPAAAYLGPLIDSAPSVDALLAKLRWHQVPPAGASRVVEARHPELGGTAAWREAVERNRGRGNDIARARALTESALLPVADRVALPASTLGPLWVHDVDVLVHSGALEEVSRALEDAGFLDVNPLLARIGRVTPSVRRFGATDAHDVLASVELCTRIHPVGPSADAAVERAVELRSGLPRLADRDAAVRRCIKVAAARRVTVRGALELLALVERLPEVPTDPDVAVAFRRGAELERRLAGPGALTKVAAHLPRAVNRRYLPMRASGARRALRRRVRPRRLRIAFSGIAGAGKSTQTHLMTERLRRLDITAVAAWADAGNRPSRVVTRSRGPRGAVIVHDRGLVDATVDLELRDRGAADPGAHRRLRRDTPRADLTFYLRVPPAIAKRRLDDARPAGGLEEAARLYDRVARESPGIVVIDAVRPPPELCDEALIMLAGALGSPRDDGTGGPS
jgi:thymidylate kinase